MTLQHCAASPHAADGHAGGEHTASELRRLDRARWAVRNDVRSLDHTSHDHVVAGASVYVLNTKHVPDSVVTIESGAPKISLTDHPGATYRARPWIDDAHKEASVLKERLEAEVGLPVPVYPVIVVWGEFAAGREYVDDVAVVHGSKLVDWLESRPADLRNETKQHAIRRCLEALPTR